MSRVVHFGFGLMTTKCIDARGGLGVGGAVRRSVLPVAHLEGGEEGGLRVLHVADLAHALLAGLLLFQQLPLAGDIAAVALRRHVLAQGGDGLARDHLPADGSLDGALEELARDEIIAAFAVPADTRDRKSVGLGEGWSGSVDLGDGHIYT